MRQLIFVTHADVVIDPDVPVTDWPLSETGRMRHQLHASQLGDVGTIISSCERKALDAAAIYGAVLGVVPGEEPTLGEIDRSSTGYMPKAAFEAQADAFFARPDVQVSGWEAATQAQTRIVFAVQSVVRAAPAEGDILIVSHGAVGALLRAWLLSKPIDRSHDQTGDGGGNQMIISLPDWRWQSGWTRIGSS